MTEKSFEEGQEHAPEIGIFISFEVVIQETIFSIKASNKCQGPVVEWELMSVSFTALNHDLIIPRSPFLTI